DGIVGQVVVDLAKGQVALLPALLKQDLQALVDLLHPDTPRPRSPLESFVKTTGAQRWVSCQPLLAAASSFCAALAIRWTALPVHVPSCPPMVLRAASHSSCRARPGSSG